MQINESFQHDGVQGFRFGNNPFGKVKMSVYVYFVDGLMIDTGHRNMRRTIVKTLSGLPVDQMFITHHHEDHSANTQAFRKHFDCPVYASSRCCEIMKNPPPISFAQRLSWGPRGAIHDLIPEDHSVKTPNFEFELIPIPGHAIDMVALYEKNQGWLFSADLFIHEFIAYFMESESMAQQIDSLKRVLELDFEVLFCNHQPKLKEGKQSLRKKLQFLQDFFGTVELHHRRGLNPEAIMEAMGKSERKSVKRMSGGKLSAINMVHSVIRDLNWRR